MTNLQAKPNLTTKQLRILGFIYRFRFLTSVQIQRLMGHKDRRPINAWLRDLRGAGFISWQFNYEAGENMKPAICSLSPMGVKHLSSLDLYPPDGLSLRRRDKDRSPAFVNRCLLLASIYLALVNTDQPDTTYEVQNASDWKAQDPDLEVIQELAPDLWVTRTTGQEQTEFLLEIFDATLPAYMVRKRIREYVDFYSCNEWQEQACTAFPTVLFVYPTTSRLIYAKRFSRALLADLADPDDPALNFTTYAKLRRHGINGDIWERA